MWFTGDQLVTDLHDADGTLGFGDVVFSLLWRIIREHVLKLLGGNEEDLLGKA